MLRYFGSDHHVWITWFDQNGWEFKLSFETKSDLDQKCRWSWNFFHIDWNRNRLPTIVLFIGICVWWRSNGSDKVNTTVHEPASSDDSTRPPPSWKKNQPTTMSFVTDITLYRLQFWPLFQPSISIYVCYFQSRISSIFFCRLCLPLFFCGKKHSEKSFIYL